DERVTDSDAFFRDRHPVLRPQPLVAEAEPTARAAEEWSRAVMRRLEGERFNVITLKWWGRPRDIPTFEQRHGLRGTFVADSAFDDLPTHAAIVCVTGDHATPAFPDVIHSGDPVPFVVAGPGVRADGVEVFGESTCAEGIFGHLRGPDMMPVLLNAADRPLF